MTPKPVEDASEYVATIQSRSSTTVQPEVAGEVTKIHVRSGDRVDAGTPLFQIDARRQEATVSSQDAAIAAQQATVTYAEQQLARSRTLLGVGAISQQELDQAQTAYDTAKSQLASLAALLREQRVTLQYYEVRAPVAGTVGDIPIRVGTRVTSDTVLTTVDRNEDLEVYVQVPLGRAPDLKLGLPLDVFDAAGHRLATTTVSFISPRVDDQTQSVLAKGRFAGRGAVRSQEFVRARIVWKTANQLVVPVLAVLRINGQPFVFLARERDGKLVAEQRPVTLGAMVGNDFIVLGGLEPNDRIVVSGVQKLMNGAPIRPT